MANKIGVLTLEHVAGIPNISLSGNQLSIEGYFSTREGLLQLQEAFRKAEGGTTVNTLIGGIQIGYDITDDSVLTQYCEFDFSHIQDGYYLLRSLNVRFEQFDAYFPFAVKLFFLGTKAFWQEGYSVYGLEERDSDWSI